MVSKSRLPALFDDRRRSIFWGLVLNGLSQALAAIAISWLLGSGLAVENGATKKEILEVLRCAG